MFKRLAFSVCWISLAVVSAALLADEPLHFRIDALIQSQFKGPVSDLCDNATFMRHASLDFVGSIPNVSGKQRPLWVRFSASVGVLKGGSLTQFEGVQQVIRPNHPCPAGVLVEHIAALRQVRFS